jgi:hypothetical protein
MPGEDVDESCSTMRVRWSSPRGVMAQRCEDGVAAAVQSPSVDTKLRKRGGGDKVLRRALARKDERERKEGRDVDGHAL